MAESILLDGKSVMSCCAYCDSEYGIGGAFVGVPVVLGAGGVERIVQLDLNEQEKRALADSVEHVNGLIEKVKPKL